MSNSAQTPISIIILVITAITLSAFGFLINVDTQVKLDKCTHNPPVKIVYKGYVPITAMTIDALPVVAMVELVGEYDEQTLFGMKFQVRKIVAESFAERRDLIEEKLETLPFVQKAAIYYTTIIIRGKS
jgi:hypothetical protein